MSRQKVCSVLPFGWCVAANGLVCLLAPLLLSTAVGSCTRPPSNTPDLVQLRIGVGTGASNRAEGMSTLIQKLSLDPVLTLGWDGRMSEGLADRWQWQDDGRSLRLNLKSGVYFHNGKRLTSAAVASALHRYIAELQKYGSPGGFEYLQGIDTPDESTIVVRLSRPDTFLLSQLNDAPISDGDDSDVGTGPFRVVTRESDFVELHQNPAYYRGRPGLDRVQIRTYDSQRSAWAAMMRGEVDMLQAVAGESVEFLEGVTSVRTLSSIRAFQLLLAFNFRHAVLRQVDVRHAITQAIDRKAIVEKGLRGHGQVADDPVWPFHWAHTSVTSRYSYDPAAARQRLDAAGLKIDPKLSNGMPSRFRFSCLFPNDDPVYERIVLMVQRDLAEVGVDMSLVPLTQKDLRTRVSTGQFEAFLYQANVGRAFDRLYGLWHTQKGGLPPLVDSRYDGAEAVLDQLRTAREEPDVRRHVAELQQRLREDAPAVFLTWLEVIRAIDRQFVFADSDVTDIFANLWRWRPSDDRQAKR